MEISSILPNTASLTDPGLGALQAAARNKPNSEDAKIADSCKQFEAILWRQMLEKALAPMLHTPDGGADKTGTYNYFLTSTIADEVSSGSSGISSALQAQLLNKNITSSKL
jgi:Rod binding domain-containing protein